MFSFAWCKIEMLGL
uniref:Uncharacterized protein n=1 Tax=Arundo donax TaxID=35708 RepID=A0A0A9BHP3_ARUDO